ncbi:MAG: TolC family protein [Gemmatimonadales bacterium]
MTRTMLRVAALLAVTAGAASAQQPATMLQAGGASASSRAFFDSARRQARLGHRHAAAAARRRAAAPSRGSTCCRIRRWWRWSARRCSNSPDIQIAQARIREFRAEAGVTGAARYPQLSANGSAATQQTVFGTFRYAVVRRLPCHRRPDLGARLLGPAPQQRARRLVRCRRQGGRGAGDVAHLGE